MNPILKDHVYGMGTKEEIEFLIKKGGMNEEEAQILRLYHEGKPDLFVQNEMSIDKKTLQRIEESIRAKLSVAVMSCIAYTLDHQRDLL